MKLAKSLTLGVALALGASGLALTAPAMAKKAEKPAAGPNVQLSKEYRAAASPISADVQAGKFDGIFPRLDALASFQAPDERFSTAQFRLAAARAGNNDKELRKAVVEMIDSKSTLALATLPQLNSYAGEFALGAKDYDEANARFQEAIRLGSKNSAIFINLAELNIRQKKYADALPYAQQAVSAELAAGRKPPEAWYNRAFAVAYTAKILPEAARWARMLVEQYPSPPNWRSAVITFRDSSKAEGNLALDLYRLLRVNKALAGGRDFQEYAQLASDRGLPGEAKALIEEGMSSGALGRDIRPINELLAVSAQKVPGDLASLAASEKQASTAASGKTAASTADAYLGYGQDAKAAALYRIALQKGQVDADAVNTRLGIALARQGMKAEAKQAFGLVTGSRSEIAIRIR